MTKEGDAFYPVRSVRFWEGYDFGAACKARSQCAAFHFPNDPCGTGLGDRWVSLLFVTKDYFLNKLERQEILEYAQYGEQYYGTPRDPVDQWLEEGKTVILKIEVQGAEKSAGYIRMW